MENKYLVGNGDNTLVREDRGAAAAPRWRRSVRCPVAARGGGDTLSPRHSSPPAPRRLRAANLSFETKGVIAALPAPLCGEGWKTPALPDAHRRADVRGEPLGSADAGAGAAGGPARLHLQHPPRTGTARAPSRRQILASVGAESCRGAWLSRSPRYQRNPARNDRFCLVQRKSPPRRCRGQMQMQSALHSEIKTPTKI